MAEPKISNAARLEIGLHPQFKSLIFHFTTSEGDERAFALGCAERPLPELQASFDQMMAALAELIGNEGLH